MAFFQTQPLSGAKYVSVKDAADKLKAFNAMEAIKMADNNPDLCGNPDDTAQWRKLIYEGVIQCGGEPMELDFFETIFGGKTTNIEAKKLFFRYNCDFDMNIFPQDNASATTAGGAVTFTLLKALHGGGGKYSYPVAGYSIYDYESKQSLRITLVDKTIDYGHRITAVPYSSTYTATIKKNKKLLIIPVNLVGGISCPSPASTYQTSGYTKSIIPFRTRVDWELPIDIMRGHEEVLQWANMFDPQTGAEIDCYEAYEKTMARRNMKWGKNVIFFMGQKIDNPALLAENGVSADYAGFDGYIPTMFYGGGQIIDYDPADGFDLFSDWEPVIIKNDALKRTNEFVVLHSKPFYMSLARKAGETFNSNTGACTFETFRRSGMNGEDITRLGVRSINWAGHSLHFKEVSALSDTRGIGNGIYPYTAHFIPGNGLRTSKGKQVSAFEFFMPYGCGANGGFEEHNRDRREIDGCDIIEGDMEETLMMAIHCPHQHILANPVGI